MRQATGYPIGGVPPFGHATPLRVFVDEDLLAFDVVWAAAGTWNDVFALTPDDLVRASGGVVTDLQALTDARLVVRRVAVEARTRLNVRARQILMQSLVQLAGESSRGGPVRCSTAVDRRQRQHAVGHGRPCRPRSGCSRPARTAATAG